jgi:hypothetical protein
VEGALLGGRRDPGDDILALGGDRGGENLGRTGGGEAFLEGSASDTVRPREGRGGPSALGTLRAGGGGTGRADPLLAGLGGGGGGGALPGVVKGGTFLAGRSGN